MGEFGLPHLIIIFFVVLLLFGAKRVPDVARSLGSAVNEFKKGMAWDAPAPQAKPRASRGRKTAPKS